MYIPIQLAQRPEQHHEDPLNLSSHNLDFFLSDLIVVCNLDFPNFKEFHGAFWKVVMTISDAAAQISESDLQDEVWEQWLAEPAMAGNVIEQRYKIAKSRYKRRQGKPEKTRHDPGPSQPRHGELIHSGRQGGDDDNATVISTAATETRHLPSDMQNRLLPGITPGTITRSGRQWLDKKAALVMANTLVTQANKTQLKIDEIKTKGDLTAEDWMRLYAAEDTYQKLKVEAGNWFGQYKKFGGRQEPPIWE